MKKPVTIKDIALECRVSANTVSLALRGSQRISERTRTRVQQVAKKMGYIRDPQISRLMSGLAKRRQNRAVINEEIAYLLTIPAPFRNAAQNPLFERTAEILKAQGYHLSKFSYDYRRRTAEQLNRIFRSRNIRGIIIAPLTIGQDSVLLDFENLSAVALGRKLKHPALHRVDNNHSYAVRVCLENLHRKGFRRPGALISSYFDGQIQYSLSGAYLAWQAMHMEGESIPILNSDTTDEKPLTSDQISAWLAKHRIDSVIYLEEVHDKLQKSLPLARRKVGTALIRKNTIPGVPGVVPDLETLSRITVALLISQMNANQFGPPDSPVLTLVNGYWAEQ